MLQRHARNPRPRRVPETAGAESARRTGARSGAFSQRRFLMGGEDESYDLAHFEFIVRAAGRVPRAHFALART